MYLYNVHVYCTLYTYTDGHMDGHTSLVSVNLLLCIALVHIEYNMCEPNRQMLPGIFSLSDVLAILCS